MLGPEIEKVPKSGFSPHFLGTILANAKFVPTGSIASANLPHPPRVMWLHDAPKMAQMTASHIFFQILKNPLTPGTYGGLDPLYTPDPAPGCA